MIVWINSGKRFWIWLWANVWSSEWFEFCKARTKTSSCAWFNLNNLHNDVKNSFDDEESFKN